MSIQETQEIKAREYAEAIRYMNNAKECLTKAQKNGKYYTDTKYVSMACGTVYIGVLKALDGLFQIKGIKPPTKGRKSIEYYRKNIGKLGGNWLQALNNAYDTLHLSGYYGGITKVDTIKSGFEEADTIINWIKP